MAAIRMRICAIALIALALGGLTPRAQAALTFNVDPNGWPSAAHRQAAVDALQASVNRYNAYGNFGNYNIYAYYNAGIPTAQASYLGSIGYGGTYPNERVTMHEMSHYLGTGTYGTPWDGARGEAMIDQFDGLEATLEGDAQHYWPYGLNYDSEGAEIDKQRQVALLYAMRADMGIGSTANPWSATSVTLTASDPAGESGFNYKTRWSDGYFAHAGAAYSTGAYAMRTPNTANSYNFVGESLTVSNASNTTGLWFQGLGTSGVVSFKNLILDGGWVDHRASVSDLFQLDGKVTVQSASNIRALNGNINVLADVTGAGTLTIQPSNNIAENNRYVRFASPANTFNGSIINASRFELTSTGNFDFKIGASGVNNAITGASARNTLLNGTFDIDLSAATSSAGSSWSLVTAANTTYGATFKVNGFDKSGTSWSNGTFKFNQATGLLTPINAWATDGGGNWTSVANWTAGVPAAGDDVTFSSALTAPNAPATVILDAPASVGRVTFDNANRYIIGGPSPGTLTLTGAATITAKAGSHEIAAPIGGSAGLTKSGAGTLALSAVNPYSGNTSVDAGTLALKGAATIANSANIRVRPAATFDVSALAVPFTLAGGQTLQADSTATIVGNVQAGAGAAIIGAGTFNNSVALQTGATFRIGAAGLPAQSAPMLIDNFDSYDNSVIQTVGAHANGDATAGKWDGVFDGTGNARIVDNTIASDNAIRVNGISTQADQWRGAVTNLATNFSSDFSLADGAKATYFFQVRREGTGDVDGVFGLADAPAVIDTNSSWNDFGVMASIYGTTSTNSALRAYSEGAGDVVVVNNIVNGTWYNVWLVVDNAAKTYEMYTSTGAANANPANPATFKTGLHFGHDVEVANLVKFGLSERLSNNDANDGALRIDNIYMASGKNIGNPLAPSGGIIYAPEIVTVQGNVTLAAGSTIAFDIATTGVNDELQIAGAFTAAGTLQVSRAAAAPALALGNTFDLFDFASAGGAFDAFNLPALATGLLWNVSKLTTTGELQVVVDVDADNDGQITGNDLLALQRDDPTLISAWQAQFGSQVVAGSTALTAAVPEPAATFLATIATVALAFRRRRAQLVPGR